MNSIETTVGQRETSFAPYVVRPLFVIATVIVLITALCQVGGRLLLQNLESLEPKINSLLAERGIELKGLEGDWRFLNPLIRVASGRMPGIEFTGLQAELDVLESLARNRLVLRHGKIDDARAVLEQDPAGAWRLVGQRQAKLAFDWQSLVWHSDRLQVGATLMVRAQSAAPSEISVVVKTSNMGGRHRGQVQLMDADGCVGCGITAAYNLEDAVPFVRKRHGSALLQVDRLVLDGSAAALVGVAALNITRMDGRWQLSENRFVGPLELSGGRLQLPGGETTEFSLQASGWISDDAQAVRYRLDKLEISAADATLRVADLIVNWAGEQGGRLLTTQLSVGDMSAVLSHTLPREIPESNWVRNLGATGEVRELFVHWDASEYGWRADFADLNLQNFHGVPVINGLVGRMAGGRNFLRVGMDGANTVIGFPEIFSEDQHYDSVRGELLLYFGPDRFGLQGSDLHFSSQTMAATGSFSLSSQKPDSESRITIAMTADAQSIEDVEPYIPYKLPANVLDWFDQSAMQADLGGTRFVMHGPLREEISPMGRSYLLEAKVADAELAFHADWPRVTHAEGVVKLSQEAVRGRFDSALMAGMQLSDLSVTLPAGARSVSASGDASFDAAAGLEFIRTTPLQDSLDFIEDDWRATGRLRMHISLDVPLQDASEVSQADVSAAPTQPDPRVSVALAGELEGMTLTMPQQGLTFTRLHGPIAYRYPFEVSSGELRGRLFDEPVSLHIESPLVKASSGTQIAYSAQTAAPRRIEFGLLGAMHTDDLWPLIGMESSRLAGGKFAYSATYATGTLAASQPTLRVDTTLAGVEVLLPAPFAKSAESVAATAIDVRFEGDNQRVMLSYAGLVNAELMIGDGEISGGRMTLGGNALSAGENTSVVRIDGRLDSADIAQWAAGDSAVELPPYEIDGLRIGVARVGGYLIRDLLLSGRSDAEHLELRFVGNDAQGSLLVAAAIDELPLLTMQRFNFISPLPPEGKNGEAVVADPLTPQDLAQLQDLQVRVDELTIDGEDFGSWSFDIMRTDTGVSLVNFSAQVKALKIDAPEGIIWTEATNRSHFGGSITSDDLAAVLAAWGYAPSLEAKSMITSSELNWPGSPLNFEVDNIIGDVSLRLKDGRFVDVAAGNNALRIFSLLNFTAIAKRMSLNFSDVFGRGIAFDKVAANTHVEQGMLEFVKPLTVKGTGGEFKLNGTINMVNGTLDNEMVVTLPVNKSLPWLGAYLALANPIAGLGVLVGERLLRKPIEGLSSAKYRIRGTLDDPEVELASVFGDSFSKKKTEKHVPEGSDQSLDQQIDQQTDEQTDQPIDRTGH